MRFLTSAAAFFFSATILFAHAAGSPPAPLSGPPPNSNPNIMVEGPLQLGNGGFWGDVYYRSNPNRFTPELIQNSSCVFVYYHGGGFVGGDPRMSGQQSGVNPVQTLANEFVGNRNCIMISYTYPLTTPAPGTPDQADYLYGALSFIWPGTASAAFADLYNNHISQWKISNPTMKIYVGGNSAGSLIAQRVALDPRFSIDESFVMALPVMKGGPGYVGAIDGCSGVDCNWSRTLWNYPTFDGTDISNYISYHSAYRPQLKTNVILNACDAVVNLGAAMRGYLNNIPNARISVRKGYSAAEIAQANGLSPVPPYTDPRWIGAQHGIERVLWEDYFQGNNSAKWHTFNASSVPAANGQTYKEYCDAGNTLDTDFFRTLVLN